MFDQTALFGAALGIQEPIYIEKIDFEEEPGELHIYMNFRPGAGFRALSAANQQCRFGILLIRFGDT